MSFTIWRGRLGSRVVVRLWLAVVVCAGFLGCVSQVRETPEPARLWDRHVLWQPPRVTWGAPTGMVQQLFYEGEPFEGKTTRVFAYIARPTNSAAGKWPGIVLAHGGGGKAFPAWAEHWAKQGYVAIAMDLSGNGPDGRLADGGPDQSDKVKFRDFDLHDLRQTWSYHAVAAVVRAHSLLRSLPEVDRERIGLTGISWGGYLTCIVAGIDPRFKVAVPVYGCGFLGENSYWKDKALAKMEPPARELWLKYFDPGQYIGKVRYPILFVNGTTDFAYPLDSYKKTYEQVPARWRNVSVAIDRPHGHIWTFPEVDAFVASVLRDAPKTIRFARPEVNGLHIAARINHTTTPKEVSLCYTTDIGTWQTRKWQSAPARLNGREVTAELPVPRPVTAFLAIKDENGCHFSSEHVELEPLPATRADDRILRGLSLTQRLSGVDLIPADIQKPFQRFLSLP
jgi:dienelactone hydrolase